MKNHFIVEAQGPGEAPYVYGRSEGRPKHPSRRHPAVTSSGTSLFNLYRLAFLRNDVAGMAKQVAWAMGKPGKENIVLNFEAETAAYSGRLAKARDFSRRAVDSAERAEEKETAADYEAGAALREALFENTAEARQRAASVLALSSGRDAQCVVALALAFAGDSAQAQAQVGELANDLAKRFPEDTAAQFNYLPTIRAQLAQFLAQPVSCLRARAT